MDVYVLRSGSPDQLNLAEVLFGGIIFSTLDAAMEAGAQEIMDSYECDAVWQLMVDGVWETDTPDRIYRITRVTVKD